MKLYVVAVGTRMPHWIEEGFNEFSRRMPRELPLLLLEIKAEPRNEGKPVAALLAAERSRIEAALPQRCRRVVLDERGADLTTRQLAARLEKWQEMGCDVAFIIGGADGLDEEIKKTADESVRLSSLTLPHALVRVLLAEQLYRALSLRKNHPYHRD